MIFWKQVDLHKHISHPCPLDSRITKHGSKAREFSLLALVDWEYTTISQRLRNQERLTEWQRQGGRSVVSISAEAWLSASSSIWHSKKAREGIALFLLFLTLSCFGHRYLLSSVSVPHCVSQSDRLLSDVMSVDRWTAHSRSFSSQMNLKLW